MTFDYQTMTTRDTPEEERRRLNIGDIWSNAAKCLSCGEVIRSTYRHKFVTCSCGALSVDGGSWDAKRVGGRGSYEDKTEMYSDYKSRETKTKGS